MLTHDTAEEVSEPTTSPRPGRARGSPSRSATTSSRARPTTGSPSTCRSPPSTGSAPTTSPGTSPGVRHELVTSLIRSLPKNLRVSFVPAPDQAREFLAAVPPGEEPLLDALERWARSTTGVVVPRDAWDWTKVPAHLQPTYRVVGETGDEQARGQGPRGAQGAAAQPVRRRPRRGGRRQRAGRDRPDRVDLRRAARRDPADAGRARGAGLPRADRRGRDRRPRGSSAPREEAAARHRLGVRRLLLLELPAGTTRHRGLDTTARLGLAGSPYPSVAELLDDLRAAILADVVDGRPPARTPAEYAALVAAGGEALASRTGPVLSRGAADPLRLARRPTGCSAVVPSWRPLPALQDMREQLARLVHPRLPGGGRAPTGCAASRRTSWRSGAAASASRTTCSATGS